MQKLTTLYTCSNFITHSIPPVEWDSFLDSFLQNLLDAQTEANFLSVGDGKMTSSMIDLSREILGRLPYTICPFPQKHYFQFLLKVKQQGHYTFQITAMGRDENVSSLMPLVITVSRSGSQK